MSKRSGGSYFQPDLLWRVSNGVGAAATTTLGIAITGVGVGETLWALVVLGLLCAIASIWWWLRVPRARVEYGSAGVVTVVGLFWTRRIQRSAIRMVVTDTDWPGLHWADDRGRPRWTILTPVATGGGWYGLLLLPSRSIEDRRRYLQRLERWARPT